MLQQKGRLTMAICDCGKFQVECECGCGCICPVEIESGGCFYICEDCPPKPTTPAGQTVLVRPTGKTQKLKRTTKIRLHCRNLSLVSLATALDKVSQERIAVPVARFRDGLTLSRTGTLEEILTALSLTFVKRSLVKSKRLASK